MGMLIWCEGKKIALIAFLQRIVNEARNGPVLTKATSFLSAELDRTVSALKFLELKRAVKRLSYDGTFFEWDVKGKVYHDEDWCLGCGEYLQWFKAACAHCNELSSMAGMLPSLCSFVCLLVVDLAEIRGLCAECFLDFLNRNNCDFCKSDHAKVCY